MKPTKLIFFLIATCIFTINAIAQTSYLYIQGDKEKSFSIKVNDVAANKYGKNYCIFPQLTAGTSKLEIIFDQNTPASQEYAVIIPENSFRAFLLTKKDGNYALYDIYQQFYLKPGDADHYFANQTLTQAPVVVEEKKKEDAPKKKSEKVKKEKQPDFSKEESPKQVLVKESVNVQPQEVVIREEEPKPTVVIEEKKEETKTFVGITTAKTEPAVKEIKLESNATPIYNNNCPTAMRDKDYDDLLKSAKALGKGDKLVKFLLSKIPNNCYTTKQVYELANLLDEEAIIYLYLKRIYPQVSDQHNFHLLEPYLFESEEWIKAFRLIH